MRLGSCTQPLVVGTPLLLIELLWPLSLLTVPILLSIPSVLT